MRKGQTGAIVIFLIIIIVALVFLWPQIQNLIRPVDGGDGVKPEYKNDVITVEKNYVSPSNPYAGSVVKVGFYVKSNAELAIPRVEVDFFDLKGLKNVDNKINCDGTLVEGTKCIFNDFDSLDFKPVEITLQAPRPDLITSETPITISYSIEYDYFGYRIATIPVIDGTTRVTPLGKFDQSKSSYGPILMDFELPPVSEREEDGKIIKEYWVVGEMPFELKMSFKHVGSGSLGIIEPVNISAGYVILNTTSLELWRADGQPVCDFNEIAPSRFSSKNSFIVPKELVCNFQAILGDDAEISASTHASFSYTYKYTRTETFTVRPIPKE